MGLRALTAIEIREDVNEGESVVLSPRRHLTEELLALREGRM